MTTTHKFIWIISSIILASCNSSNQENVQENIQENDNKTDTTIQKTKEYSDSEYDFNESYLFEDIWQSSDESVIEDESILRKLKENDPYAPEGVRFYVENDSIAENFFFEQNVRTFFEKITMREVLYMPEEHKQMRIVPNIQPHMPNGLLETVRNAYQGHHPLALSPDVIWLTICQGMSKHINLNFKLLENKIYKNGHPESIFVRIDSLAFDSTQWSVAIDSLAQQTRRYTDPNFYEAFVPQFSTTTPINHVAYQITLLHAQQNAFSYDMWSGCGIPWIVLRGTTEDWEMIKNKLSILDTLGMTEWKESLTPILDEFIEASQGRANEAFWVNIYKDKYEYDTYAITGWIHQLFPYIDYDQPNPFLTQKITVSDDLTSSHFPNSLLKVPFVWHNVLENRTDTLYFWSGILGAKQYGDKTLEPFISWALTKGNYKKEFVEKYLEMRRSWENNK
ncbi:MAG: DUF4419 domain-containing protein [Paludibacteraceae bacterium]|nr:DUF4419 domain-containing protein [Paludibacteraceae bacterium]